MRACDSHSLIWRKVRDSNPRYDVMRTPHFECGSFDHSDNFPVAIGKSRFRMSRCDIKRVIASALRKTTLTRSFSILQRSFCVMNSTLWSKANAKIV